MEGESIRAGPAIPGSTGLAPASAIVEPDRALRDNGAVSVMVTGRRPRGSPVRANPRDPATPAHDRAIVARLDPTGSHRRMSGTMALRGVPRLQRKAVAGTAQRRASRRRAVADLPRQGRTRLRAGAILLRGRIRALAVPAEVRAETLALREAVPAEATVGNRANLPAPPRGGADRNKLRCPETQAQYDVTQISQGSTEPQNAGLNTLHAEFIAHRPKIRLSTDFSTGTATIPSQPGPGQAGASRTWWRSRICRRE